MNDLFGHGTHISFIIAWSPTAATWVTPLYKGGIAPGAHLINVKVLGANGARPTGEWVDESEADRARRTELTRHVHQRNRSQG